MVKRFDTFNYSSNLLYLMDTLLDNDDLGLCFKTLFLYLQREPT